MRAWGWFAVAIVVAALVAAAGERVGRWHGKAEAAQKASDDAAQILSLTASNATLRLSIADQNKAVAVAEAQAESARATTKVAEAYAADMAKLSESRMTKIEKALKDAKTVGEVLSRYWELRQ